MRSPPKVEYYPCLLLIITRIEVEDGAYIIYIFYFNLLGGKVLLNVRKFLFKHIFIENQLGTKEIKD